MSPEQYGLTVARVAAITYGKRADEPSLVLSGIGRAEAMAYRDSRGQGMTDSDWLEVECRLRRAYRSLRAAVADRNSQIKPGNAHIRTRAGGLPQVQKSPGRSRGF
ncbi:hypothetical protein CQ12_14140 [Bradyrhizobium jicamae]|uniref:Uncharacterized protein n=1 Tax=Bradyrhizobium jicamae TaxID=280332 RepID=A0A0R3LXX4_9BRAD|nr:hypothetical protein CQ12_14140 [Bradyrhizobium jicamae]